MALAGAASLADGFPDDRLTRFPDLRSNVAGSQDVRNARTLELELTKADESTAIFFWGVFLSRYTGNDEVAFMFDDDIVTVQINNWTFERNRVEGDISPLRGGTGIFIQGSDREAKKLAVWLSFEQENDHYMLSCASIIPQSHLRQLVLQLQVALHHVLSLKSPSVPRAGASELSLSISNYPPSYLKGPRLLHELISQEVSRLATAIEFWDHENQRISLSYEDLEKSSSNLALNLLHIRSQRSQPTTRASPIILFLPQSPALYISMIAVLKTASAFCTLSVDLPPDRINFILKDTAADIVIAESSLVNRIPKSEDGFPEIIPFDDELCGNTGLTSKSLALPKILDGDLAYLYYTSGSTGIPKGVAIPHCSVVQSLLAHDVFVPSFSRFLQFATPTFDVFIFEVFFPLFRGATLVSQNRQHLLLDLPGFINENEIDAAELTPSVARDLLQKRAKVPRLKLLITIGEMLTQPVIREFANDEDNSGILLAAYGPTECAVHCTIQPNFPNTARQGIIGKPLDTVAAFVIKAGNFNSTDEKSNIMPVGQVGELAIGGNQLADGYINRPKESRNSFIKTHNFGVLYRTGDIVRQLPDGTLEMLGRINSDQVKLRGQRVELGEVENTLSLAKSCLGACVMIIDNLLIAFCAVQSKEASTESFKLACKRWLPSYMVPAKIILLEKFPYLASGKMNRKALEQLYRDSLSTTIKSSDNASHVLKVLHGLASEILDHAVDVNDEHLIDSLDSLTTIRFVSSSRKLGYKVTMLDLIEAGCLKDVAEKVSSTMNERSQDDPIKPLIPLDKELIDRKMPFLSTMLAEVDQLVQSTPIQLAMLSQTLLNPSMYCNWILLRFSPPIDCDRVRRHIFKLAHSNEILRSGFLSSDPTIQIIWKCLSDEQVTEVDRINYDYSLSCENELLRPFRAQIREYENSILVLIQLPHFMYDGWSLDLMLADMSDLCDGKELNPRPQYRKVSEYYQRYHTLDEYELSRNFWREQVQNISTSSLTNYNGYDVDGNHQLTSFRDIKYNPETIPGEENLPFSSQVLIQSAFAYLLCSYYGKSDITFGLVTSGRTLPVADADKIVGPCINTVPVHIQMSKMRTVADLLQNVHDLSREVLKYGLLPLRDIKSLSNLDQGSPMFDTLFNWQKPVRAVDSFEKQHIQLVDSADFLEFKLVLEVEPGELSLRLKVRYHSSVFHENQAKVLLNQVEELTKIFNKSQQISLISLSQRLSQSNLSISHMSKRDEPYINPVKMIQSMARTCPDSPAVQYYTAFDKHQRSFEVMTYEHLNRHTNSLARCIRATVRKSTEIIPICMYKSIDAYVAILSVVKAGFGYLFILPETPHRRKIAILGQSGTDLCMSHSRSAKMLKDISDFTILNIGTLDLSKYPSDDLNLIHNERSVAYATFTSGTSGNPKGVLVTLKNLQSNVHVLSDQYPAFRGDRLLQFCSLSFDVSVFDIFYSWCAGICLCAADNDLLFRDFELAIESMSITHLSLTPTVARLLDVKKIPKVRFLVTAGEAVTSSLIREWARAGLYQGYGPSETTNICTLRPRVAFNELPSNIGWPLRNTSVFVLEEGSANIVPRGGLGELCFGGDQVARGYVGYELLQNEKFCNHPVGGRLYRSGDLGRLLPNGSLLFHGRLDSQIKIRGQRVEMGELNSCISKASFIRECASVLIQPRIDDMQPKPQLLSFWVPTRGFAVAEMRILECRAFREKISMLFERLTSDLPSYMVPTHLVPISKIPITTQGKVDASALSNLFDSMDHACRKITAHDQANSEENGVESETEKSLSRALSEILCLPSSSIQRFTSFMSLGLDSITAVPLSKSLSVPVSMILRYSSVASLARALDKGSIDWRKPSAVKLEEVVKELFFDVQRRSNLKPGDVKEVLPCTPLQEAMLSATEFSNGVTYNNRMLFRVNGDFDLLRKSWQSMVTRHDILRTVFVPVEHQHCSFAQVILKTYHPCWISETEEGPDFNRKSKMSNDDLNLQNWHVDQPRYYFIERCMQGTPYLLFICHHALYDGLAMENLLKEVEMCYMGHMLPPVLQYEPYLKQMYSLEDQSTNDFWSNHMRNYEPVAFPILRAPEQCRPQSTEYQSVRCPLSLSLSYIEAQCKDLSINLLSLGQAIWAKMLAIYTGKKDVCIGNVVSGRNLDMIDLNGLIAPCFNTIPIRIDFGKLTRNVDLANRLKEHNVDCLPFQLTSLRYIKKFLKSRTRLVFDTIFLLQRPKRPLNSAIWSLEEDAGDMDLALIIELQPDLQSDLIELRISFDSFYMSTEQAEIIMKTYDGLFASFLRYPAARIFDNGILAEDILSASKTSHAEDMIFNSATRSILTQIGFSNSEGFAIVSEAGQVLPMLGIGKLFAAIRSGSSHSHNIDETYCLELAGTLNNQKMLDTGLYSRMHSMRSLSLIPFVNGLSQESLSIYSEYLNRSLESLYSGVKNVMMCHLRNSGSFDRKFVVVIEAQEQDPKILADIESTAQARLLNVYPSKEMPCFYIAAECIPLAGNEIDECAISGLLEARHNSKATQAQMKGSKHSFSDNLIEDLSCVYSEFSGVPLQEIGPKTSFFELGLDSINAIQISARLREHGRWIAATAIIENPIIEELIACIKKDANEISTDNEIYSLARFENDFWSKHTKSWGMYGDDIEAVRPCTAMQEGMISQFINSDGRKYYNHIEYINTSFLDVGKLLQTWEDLVFCHPILRTGFIPLTSTDHCFAMIIYRDKSKAIPVEVCSGQNSFSLESQAFLIQSAGEILQNLRLPPWRLRIARRKQKTSMQFFALHALYDAQSLEILFDDITYRCCEQKPRRVINFDPLLGKLLSRASDHGHSAESYWKMLKNEIVVSAFPFISSKQATSDHTFTVRKKHTQHFDNLHKACRKSGVTLQALAQAAWSRLLAAYLGVEDVIFGVVLAGRTDPEDQNVAFPCINTVPFHCSVQRSNASLLQLSMDFNKMMQRYQNVPLARVQRWIGRANETLFDTVLVCHRLASRSSHNKIWHLQNEIAATEFAISIELQPQASGELVLTLTSKPSVLARNQAKILLDQYDQALIQVAESPRSSQDDFLRHCPSLNSHLSPKNDSIPIEGKLLHELMEITSQRHPSNKALEFYTGTWPDLDRRSWTYQEMDKLGNKIAHLIFEYIGSHSLVAVCFDKCSKAYPTILGILKSGNAFVALDPAAPQARKAFILKDSEAQLVISCGEAYNELAELKPFRLIDLDHIDLDRLSESRLLSVNTSPSDTCYCLYTSGSTGLAKGCDISHENAVQAMAAFHRLFAGHWQTSSRWLQFASFHFDVSVLEQYWSWSAGITLVSAPKDLILQDLSQFIREMLITHIDLTPSLAQTLVPEEVPTLCQGIFIVGGEPLKKEIVELWGEYGVIYNGYGPTETTIGVTMLPRVSTNDKPSNIGWQFDNVGAFVSSSGSEDFVVRGGVGELCIYGKLVGKGYRNRSELTKERFPYHTQLKVRYYRTGDVVRLLHDNTFEYIGRLDSQVKLRGQRLELSEIDSVIKVQGSKVATVITRLMKHSNTLKDTLVSFVVFKGQSQDGVEEKSPAQHKGTKPIRDICASNLPPYMVPTYIIPISSIPLTANNKVDNFELQRIFEAWCKSERNEALQSETGLMGKLLPNHQKIADILSQVLRIELSNVSPKSNLFNLGLDSISMIKFVLVLKEYGFAKAETTLVMHNPTISSFATALDQSNAEPDETQAAIIEAKQRMAACKQRHMYDIATRLGIRQESIENICPCTPLQEGMIVRSLASEQGLYFTGFYYIFQPEFDIARLQSAWKRVYASLQLLRIKFVATDSGYVQVALNERELPWIEVKSNEVDNLKSQRDLLRKSWITKNETDMMQPFELVLIHSENTVTLAMHIFHGLYDAISLSRLIKCVTLEYECITPVVYGPNYLHFLSSGPLLNLPSAKSYWEEHLAQARHLLLPQLTDVPSDEDIKVTMDLNNHAAIESRRQNFNVTSQAFFQACWISVLYEYFGNVVTIGLVVSGRSLNVLEVADVIGPLLNTVPFCLQIKADDTWRSLARKCHEINVASTKYHHTPLRDVIKWMDVEQGNVLFDTLFSYRGFDLTDSSANHLWKKYEETNQLDFALALEVQQTDSDSIALTLATRKGISNEEKSLELLSKFREAVVNAIEQPDSIVIDQVSGYHLSANENDENPTLAIKAKQNIVEDSEVRAKLDILRKEIAALASVNESELQPSSSIFEFGLDSIDIMKLSSRLKSHQFSIRINNVMKDPILGNIAANMTTYVSTDKCNELIGKYAEDLDYLRSAVTRSRPELVKLDQLLPATPLQESLVAQMIHSDYSRYFNHEILKIRSDVNIDRLKSAWVTVYDNSPILRTFFLEIEDPSVESTFVQIVRKSTFPWEEIHLPDISQAGSVIGQVKEKVKRQGKAQGFFALTLVTSSASKYLVLSLSHALYDAWSISLLHTDVYRAYHGRYTTRPGYEKIVRRVCEGSSDKLSGFWTSYLSEAKLSLLWPELPPFAELKNGDRDRQELVSSIASERLQKFCKRFKVTVQAVSQTCFALVLASYLRNLDVCFGITISGRESEEDAQMLFPMMNTVIMRSVLFGTRLEMIYYTQDNMSSIRPHQQFPLRKILSTQRKVNDKLFDTLFIYQKHPNDNNRAERLYEPVSGVANAEFPLCVEVEIVEDQVVWRLACSSYLAAKDFGTHYLQNLDNVLSHIIDDPHKPTFESRGTEIAICGLKSYRTQVTAKAIFLAEKDPMTNSTASDSSWTELESTIRNIICTVTRVPVESVGRNISIFHLGLDSISILKVAALLRKKGIHVAVSQLLQAANIKDIAKLIEGIREGNIQTDDDKLDLGLQWRSAFDIDGILGSNGLNEDDVDCVLPISPMQLYMLTMWEISMRTLFYSCFTFKLNASVTYLEICNAWRSLVSTTSILRTVFLPGRNSRHPIVQVILKDTAVQVRKIMDVSERHVSERYEQPYVRLEVANQEGSWLLAICIHHALYDAFSLQMLKEKFIQLLGGISLSPEPIDPYVEYVTMCHVDHLVEKRYDFWKRYLSEAKPLQLCSDIDNEPTRTETFRASVIKDVGKVKKIANGNGLTVGSVILALYAQLYAKLANLKCDEDQKNNSSSEIIFGVYIANRGLSIDGLMDITVPTLNLVPLRVNYPISSSIVDLAVRIHQDLQRLGDGSNALVSLWEIKQWTGVVLDSFVNFLGDIDAESREEQEKRPNVPSTEIRLEEVPGTSNNLAKYRDFHEANKGLLNDEIRKSYQMSLDIEFSVRNLGLDVGIFAPSSLVTLSEANKLLDDLQTDISSLCHEHSSE